jgi:hypothetical protein
MKFTDKNLKGDKMIRRAENVSTLWMFRSQSLNIDEDRNKDKLVLFDNVQFIYELALAQLELYALDVDFEVKNGLREFKLLRSSNIDNVIKRTAYFKIVDGRYTDYF